MINLLLIDDSLPLGGKETMLLDYLKNLDRDIFRVHVATLTSNGELIAEAKKYSDHYFCLERKTAVDICAIWRLRRIIVDHHIQLVHTNQWIDSLYIYASTVGLKVKKVSTIHGNISGWRRQIYRAILRRFDRVICVSESSRTDLISQGYSKSNLDVIYNGISLDDFRKTESCSSDRMFIHIGMTGSFRKERDHLTLCRAVHHLVQAGDNRIKVRLIGAALEPEREAEVKCYCKEKGLYEYIRFIGPCRDIPQQLSQLDIYVASSISETFGLALVEAMACGLPVIASDIPAFMEIIEHGKYGLHFQVGNAEELAQHIGALMKDKALRVQYGGLARKRAAAFSIASSVRRMESLYEHLVG